MKTWKSQWLCYIFIYMELCKILWRKNTHSRQIHKQRHSKTLSLLTTRPSSSAAIIPINWKCFNMPLSNSFCMEWMDKGLHKHSDCSVGRSFLVQRWVSASFQVTPWLLIPMCLFSSLQVDGRRCSCVLLVSVLLFCFCQWFGSKAQPSIASHGERILGGRKRYGCLSSSPRGVQFYKPLMHWKGRLIWMPTTFSKSGQSFCKYCLVSFGRMFWERIHLYSHKWRKWVPIEVAVSSYTVYGYLENTFLVLGVM